MTTATKLDPLGESEEELEEEATELRSRPYGGKKRGQAYACPRPTRVTVSGFSRYSNSVASLPTSEQTRVKKVAGLIIRSFRPSCRPIIAVCLVGHADFDPLRERRDPGFMTRLSRARALAVRQALQRLINNRAISSRIAWDVLGAGASQLVVQNPTTEAGRRHNRRVEIRLSGKIGSLEFEGGPTTGSKPNRFTFQSGKQSTPSAVYVPDPVWKQTPTAWVGKRMDLLVFFHGDQRNIPGSPCKHDFDPEKVIRGFRLDTQIDNATRKVALAVPIVPWKPRTEENIKGIWTAARFNAFVEEVLTWIKNKSKIKTELGGLIIAGHSRAHGILTPLAREFDQGTPDRKTGALAQLTEVWALDTTYDPQHVRALEAWAYRCPEVQFRAVLSKSKERDPLNNWNKYTKTCSFGFKPPPNLKICAVTEDHCTIPTKYIGRLLSTDKSLLDWCKP